MPMAGTVAYSCTKTFASYLAIGLNYELKGKVDCIAFEPAMVATKMLGEKADGALIVTPTAAVKAMLADLGRQSVSHGAWQHALEASFVSILPLWLVNKAAFPGLVKAHQKELAEGKADRK